MDFSIEHHREFLHHHVSELPTPSFILSKPVLERNISQLLHDVAELGLSFRPHVKTLKSIQVTRMMLDHGTHRKVVASTLCEIRGLLPLAEEGILDECLYGLPICSSALKILATINGSLRIVLMIDNMQHVDLIEKFSQQDPKRRKWPVFIKIDVGTHRAGVLNSSHSLLDLVKRAASSTAVELTGFYCHAGHSYSCQTTEAASKILEDEVNGVIEAANLIKVKDRKLIISVGATPTAHVIKSLKTQIPFGLELELHAGNFCANDLQQVATGLIRPSDQAIRVLAEVCSIYEERNEALINAGVIALTRESSAFPGFGKVLNPSGWNVVRLSQEHGILGLEEGHQAKVQDHFEVGQKVLLWCQHACITASAYHIYYIVNEDDVVIDIWKPWKGW